jgi:hypothetical protein
MDTIKLNIGSGRDLLEGYVNVDLHDTGADIAQSAHCMSFADETAAELRAAQLLEHLGYFKALYFLSEAYRILRPDGTLVIETPDIEKAFARFGAAERPARERLMQWIYGLETPGMGHVFCFPRELLEERLAKQGFALESVENFETEQDNPSLRFTARKKKSRAGEMLFCRLRQTLVKKNIAAFADEASSAALEGALDNLKRIAAPEGLLASWRDEAAMRECLYQAAVCAPLAANFFRLMEEGNDDPSLFHRAALILEGGAFSSRCLREFEAIPAKPMAQDEAYMQTLNWARAAIDKILAGETVCDACASSGTEFFGDACYRKEADGIFAPVVLSKKGEAAFASALKLLIQDDRQQALHGFETSLKLYRNCPETYLNMARLNAAMNLQAKAERLYDQAAQCFELSGRARRAQEVLREKGEICLIEGVESIRPAVPWREGEQG